DLYTAVHTNATVVVLMGYAKLQQIVALYQDHGRGDLPIALIQNGSLPNERIAVGTIDNILTQVHKNLLGVPAIIGLGEVVSKHREFKKLQQEIQHIEHEMNTLFPIDVKMDQIRTVVVGGGQVGWEKLEAIFRNSPQARVHIVAEQAGEELKAFIALKSTVQLSERLFVEEDLEGVDLVIMATNNPRFNAHIQELCAKRHILLNVADKPDL